MTEQILPEALFPKLDLLLPELTIEQDSNGGFWVLDILRRKKIKLTPEEWVRQHVLFWLLKQTGYPASLLSVERKVHASSGNRADVIGYGKQGTPLLLVECKAPGESISSITGMQAMKYNQHLNASFIWLTNGISHAVLKIREGVEQPAILPGLPSFAEMAG
ncbi:MAG TPA: type I restriction enzyme HsdR N-terminal domain-containing protein [Catalimonadaceae bacterium]|nr:type I restriction enzyme HsdR N-terminal domain-containing protein [Catalimonadaceae bacterium]